MAKKLSLYSTAMQNFSRWGFALDIPPTRNFALGIPTCWYLETLKFALSPNANAKICVTPNASQWNIGCVGSPGVGACIGHVHFMLFVSISFALGSQRERSFQWNMGFSFQHCWCLYANSAIFRPKGPDSFQDPM